MYIEAHFAENRPVVSLNRENPALSESAIAETNGFHGPWTTLFGEEHPPNMLVLLTVLVTSAHALGIVRLLTEPPMIRPAQPLPMQVEMIALPPVPQIQPAPPQPVPPEPKPVVKKQAVKPVVKPAVKKEQPAVKQPAVKQAEPEVESSVAPAAAPASVPVAAPPAVEKTAPPVFTEPNYRANYAINPRPIYPSVARSHGWQGKVALRVQVTAEGDAAAVQIERSSGYEVLDEAAIEAVKQWRFVPAKRGDTPVDSSVVVPLNFALHEE